MWLIFLLNFEILSEHPCFENDYLYWEIGPIGFCHRPWVKYWVDLAVITPKLFAIYYELSHEQVG
jgi:hypothetical protein